MSSASSIIISQFIVFNIVPRVASLVAVVLMELMEVILWDGLIPLGNQSIYFMFQVLSLFYFSSFHIFHCTWEEATLTDILF